MSKKHRGRFKGDPVTYQLPNPAGGVQLETFVPWNRENSPLSPSRPASHSPAVAVTA